MNVDLASVGESCRAGERVPDLPFGGSNSKANEEVVANTARILNIL